uniref:Uncharacterized protein n=1 Tax=Setaria italica TaxID=4555 RepID=K4AHU8_SETIT
MCLRKVGDRGQINFSLYCLILRARFQIHIGMSGFKSLAITEAGGDQHRPLTVTIPKRQV